MTTTSLPWHYDVVQAQVNGEWFWLARLYTPTLYKRAGIGSSPEEALKNLRDELVGGD